MRSPALGRSHPIVLVAIAGTRKAQATRPNTMSIAEPRRNWSSPLASRLTEFVQNLLDVAAAVPEPGQYAATREVESSAISSIERFRTFGQIAEADPCFAVGVSQNLRALGAISRQLPVREYEQPRIAAGEIRGVLQVRSYLPSCFLSVGRTEKNNEVMARESRRIHVSIFAATKH